MQQILLLLTLFVFAINGNAQTYLIESFDNSTFHPEGWLNVSVNGSNLWSRATSGQNPACSTKSGDGMVSFNSFSINSDNSALLVSKSIDLSERAGKVVNVSFWMYRDNGYLGNDDNVEVYFNSAANLSGATWFGTINRSTALTPAVASPGWYKYTYAIPASYTSSNNYLLFKAISDYGNNIYLDDILVMVPPNDDAGVVQITSPSTNSSSGLTSVKAIISNFGVNPLTSAVINWSVNNVVQPTVAYTNAGLASGVLSSEITLGDITLLQGTEYSIKVWSTLPNTFVDGDILNDSQTITFTPLSYASLPYTQSFESTWITKVSTHDAPDIYSTNASSTGDNSLRRDDDGASAGWSNSTVGVYTPSGAKSTTHSARFHSINAYASTDYFINVDLSAEGSKKISFYTIGENSQVNVYRSDNGGLTESWVGSCSMTSAWKYNEFDLGSGVSSTTRFRIHFYSVATSGNEIGIDEISIKLKSNNDAGISGFDYNINDGYPKGLNDIKFTLMNYGANELNSATINWSVNGVLQSPKSFTSLYLSPGSSDLVSLGTYDFSSRGNYTLKAWITFANGVADNETENNSYETTVYVESFASLPYTQNFDNNWVNKFGIKDVPDLFWRNAYSDGNLSWRRDDDGASANWENVTSGVYTPAGANSTAHSARYHASNNAWSFNYLHVDLSAVGNKVLTFWYMNKSNSDSLRIYVRSINSSSVVNPITFKTSPTWTKYTVSLGDAQIPNAIITFYTDGDYYGSEDIGIDELSVKSCNSDAGIKALLTPDLEILPSSQMVSTQIKNFGTAPLTSLQIGWSVNGVNQTPVTYTSAGLVTGALATVNLGNFNFIKSGYNSVKIWTYLPNGLVDEAPSNDALTSNIYVKGVHDIPYFENFDLTMETTPPGFKIEDADADLYKWINNSNSNHSAPNSMFYDRNSTTINDWFFTPGINLIAGKTYKLCFWMKSKYYYSDKIEKLEIKLGTSASSSGMVSAILYNNSVITTDWIEESITFVPTASGVYYLGFHNYGDIESSTLFIDDISVIENILPNPPTSVTAVAGTTDVVVSFTAPISNAGGSITSYIVKSSPSGILVEGAASPITVTGLPQGTPYTFTVVSKNLVGESIPSSPSNSVTLATVPDAPTSVTAVAGNGQTTVSFVTPVSNGGSTITSYTVTSNPGNFTATGASSPLTVTGLTNGTSYTFTVVATNSKGNSISSASSESVTPATVPDAPTSVMALAGNGQATVSFIAPASNGGSAITSYTVTSNPDNLKVTGINSPLTVTGLSNGVSYTFTIVATNTKGNSEISSLSNSVIPSILTPLDINGEDVIELYPNPVSTGFNLFISDKPTLVTIYDLSGLRLMEQVVEGKTYIDISSYPAGTYIVRGNGFNAKVVKVN